MVLDELIAALASNVLDEHIRDLENRIVKAELRFEAESREKIVDEEFLSRAYCL